MESWPNVKRILALSMAACLLSGTSMPAVAAACEGGGEETGEVEGEAPVNFGSVTVGNTAEISVTFKNKAPFTSNILRLEAVPVLGNGFTINAGSTKNTCKGQLGPFVTCKVPVKFKPTEKRKYESEIELELEMNIFPNQRYHGEITVTGQGI